MKSVLPMLLGLLLPTLCAASKQEHGYIVVRGELTSCDGWNRVLDVAMYHEGEPIELLGLSGLDLAGLSPDAIADLLASEIQKRTGREPSSIQVTLVVPGAQIQGLVQELSRSMILHWAERCPEPNSEPPGLDIEDYDQWNEQIRRRAVLESVA